MGTEYTGDQLPFRRVMIAGGGGWGALMVKEGREGEWMPGWELEQKEQGCTGQRGAGLSVDHLPASSPQAVTCSHGRDSG